ncbi:30S ribosomal protein S15 [Globomyces sp. JEL0801]|nr:30S ribosomal protein S15 [Globomyces sp. JEL0801]
MQSQTVRWILPQSQRNPIKQFIAGFHTSKTNFGRYPALPTRISRSAHAKNLKKIESIKSKVGEKYKVLGREKRQSPYSERRSPSKPTQPPPPVKLPIKIEPFLAAPNKVPAPIVPGNLEESLRRLNLSTDATPLKKEMTTKSKGSIKMGHISQNKTIPTSSFLNTLKLEENAIPNIHPLTDYPELEVKTAEGPYYQHGIVPSEIEFVLKSTPMALKDPLVSALDMDTQKAEMIRRILSIENASAKGIANFNKTRVMEIFQRNPQDTGSSEVQAAIMMVKINAVKDHLEKNPKDKSTKRRLQTLESKQRAILKYLRRQDLPKFVTTCEAIGVDAKSFA